MVVLRNSGVRPYNALMNPRLLVTSGPGTGTVYPIPMDGTEVTVGREADNTMSTSQPFSLCGERKSFQDRSACPGMSFEIPARRSRKNSMAVLFLSWRREK